jgi:hypothetical protein
MTYSLRESDRGLRWMITLFLALLSCGYAVGLLYVEHTTSMSSPGVQEQFLGSPEGAAPAEVKYARSPGEMFTFIHNHVFSMALMFLVLGVLLYGTSVFSPAWKRFLMIEPFVAIATTFGGIALIRYFSPLFSWLVIVSGVSLACVYLLSVGAIMVEMWGRPRGRLP